MQNYFLRELIFAKMKKENILFREFYYYFTLPIAENNKLIKKPTRFYLLRGGVVCAKVIDKNHRRFLLVQGGLEIPVQVTAEMDLTERNKAILEKYKQIVVSNYKEPGIDGHFDDCTKEVLKGLEDDDSDTDEEVQSNTDSEN